jgi:hypothetical protein
MMENLPGLETDARSFRKHVHDTYRAIYASNCFGHNPPTQTTMMEKAIYAVIYQFSAGEWAIDDMIKKIKDNKLEG